MKRIRKVVAKLRFLMWVALAVTLYSYVLRPLRNMIFPEKAAPELCAQARSGQRVIDGRGRSYSWNPSDEELRGAGDDGQPGTSDDVIMTCK